MLVPSSHSTVFTSIGFQLAYLIISISTKFIYTILITGCLILLRKCIMSTRPGTHQDSEHSVVGQHVEMGIYIAP
jgi:hypothetical protein